MRGQRYWFKSGCIEHGDSAEATDNWIHVHGHVRLITGELGTEIKWDQQAPCIASLQAATAHAQVLQKPFILRYFCMGWFEEIFDSFVAVERRVEDIIARGDRHFTRRVFVEHGQASDVAMPDLLKHTLRNGKPSEEYAVICHYDRLDDQFVVNHVGRQTPIGRVWGTFTSSPPCDPNSALGDTVNATYHEVICSGQPSYDRVIALMRFPDETRRWVPYHRLVMPYEATARKPAVASICEIGDVGFRVI